MADVERALSHAIDFHNHVIPGVDDGATDDAESASALEAMRANGITELVATPHVDGSLTLRPEALLTRLAEIDAGWTRLQAIAQRFGAIRVHRGAEVMLDTPEPDLSDARLRLARGRFVLVEYPYMTVPPHSTRVIELLLRQQVVPIIAHPERYTGMSAASALPAQWREAGALLQINAGSLTGRYRAAARSNAFTLLERGLVDYVCSDYHARGQPAITAARNLLLEMDAAEQAELLFAANPRRMIKGELPIPVPPWAPRQTLWTRLSRKWRQ